MLRIALDSSNEAVNLVATSTSYNLTLGAGFAWSGTAPAGTSVTGSTLTVDALGLAAYGTIEIVSGTGVTGTAVNFADSGAHPFQGNVEVTLANAPGPVSFQGTTSLSGSRAIRITTEGSIGFASGSRLATVDGPLTLLANQQASAASFGWAGIDINNATVEATGTGAVTLKGRGGAGANPTPYGVYVHAGGRIRGGTTAGEASRLNVEGTGPASGTDFNHGVYVTDASSTIESSGADVRVIGTAGGSGYSANNNGVWLLSGGRVTAGNLGTVTVVGQGGSNSAYAGGNNYGVWVFGATSAISSQGGAISVVGNGGGNGGWGRYNYGVALWYGGSIAAGGASGSVTVTGTGGRAQGIQNLGVYLLGVSVSEASRIESAGGDITVNGTGNGIFNSAENHGVFLSGVSRVTAGGAGRITVQGQGGVARSTSNVGVKVEGNGGNALIRSTDGAVLVQGTGGGSSGDGSNNFGVSLTGGGSVTATGALATVTVDGVGGKSSWFGNYGVYVESSSGPSEISSGGGAVKVTGTGGGTSQSDNNYGVFLLNSGRVTAGGLGAVSVTGTGGPSAIYQEVGVYVWGTGSRVSSGGGPVTVTGNGGGTGAGSSNTGLYVRDGGQVTAGGTGAVEVKGTGGTASGSWNLGVIIGGQGSRITSGGGPVTVTGVEGAGSFRPAIMLSDAGAITTASSGGSLTIRADSLYLSAGTAIAGAPTGTVAIAPRTAGVGIDLGSPSVTPGGPLSLSAAGLSLISGGTLALGSPSTGSITISDSLTLPAGSDLVLTTAPTAGVIPAVAGTDLTLGGKTLRFGAGTPLRLAIDGTQVDSGYRSLKVAGRVDLTGAALLLTGSYTPQLGNGFTLVTATSLTGSFSGLPAGAATTFNGIPMAVASTATDVNLSVAVAPSITQQPIHTTVLAGTQATFTVAASGNPAPALQWQRSNDGGQSWSNLAGASASAYSLATSAADAGSQYRAVVTNAVGTVTSQAATLTVQVPPSITTQPSGGTYLPGTTTVLSVAASGSPTPSVQWQILTAGVWSAIPGATATSLGVSVSESFAQSYRAVVTSSVGTLLSDAATVQAASNVTSQILAVRSGLILNRTTGLFTGTIRLSNLGATALGSFTLMLAGLPTGVELTNASGRVTDGTPYLNLGPLAVGQSLTVWLSFRRTVDTPMTYTPRFYVNA